MTWESFLEWIPSLGSVFNSAFLLTFTYVFIRVVAPKLAKKEWADKNIANLADIYTEAVSTITEMRTVYSSLKKDLIKIEKVLETMAVYSNLGDAPKSMIQSILSDLEDSEDAIKEFSEETQEVIKEVKQKTEEEMAKRTKSALEILAEELEEAEEEA